MSAIGRIEKLIALAGSANEHEARSAAFLACKLIREGGYRLVEADHDPWAEHVAAAAAAWARPRPRAERSAPRKPPPDLRPRRPVPSEVRRAKWSGRCAQCGEEMEEGSEVGYPTRPGDERLGAVHADCRARWTVVADE